MVCVSVLYPNTPGKKFDHDYYLATHMPLVMSRLKSLGLIRYEVDKGLAGATPGSPAPFISVGRLYFNTLAEFEQSFTTHAAEILADVPNYTDIELQVQVSELTPS
jgi:uncharacterized protein (TIGR02118 family)